MRWPLYALFVFTLLSGVGYATFGRNPEWLQLMPDSILPELSQFFGIAFTFFARGHIWLSAVILIFYLIQRTGAKWIPALILVYLVSLGSELSGTRFGIPFGDYTYTDLLGAKWFNLVPYLIPLSWFTMALPSFALSFFAFPKSGQAFQRIVFAALLLSLWDLALDPAMSYLTTYWTWADPGTYYGMPWINLGGWYVTSLAIMVIMHFLRVDQWIEKLSFKWVSAYYGLVLLLPLLMCLAAGLWGAIAFTLGVLIPCAWLIERNNKNRPPSEFDAFGTFKRVQEEETTQPDDIQTDKLKDYFSSHSRSFSFAARFFSQDQYQLVTRLYAFCRVTDDIADAVAIRDGIEKAEKKLDDWEERVNLSYQGIPSGIDWLDQLMTRSNQSGVPFNLIQDLIAGVRTDLREVEIRTIDELDRYCYCVASVVGIWLCYLFGVRDREVIDRAAAMGRAMQVTNILRDVGEDLKMNRLYLPTEAMQGYGVSKDDIIRMDSGKLPITEGYKALIEDLMEKAEADYKYAFRGLSAIPPSFARAAAVASEVYKGIHRSLRRNKYDNFKRRAYTKWYEKVFLALRAIRRLKQVQNRPFISKAEPAFVSNQQLSNNHSRQQPLIVSLIVLFLCFQSMIAPLVSLAQPNTQLPLSSPSEELSETLSQTQYVMDSNSPFVQQVRLLYISAVEEEAAIKEAMALIESAQHQNAILKAYEAGLTVLKAKHAFWPTKKMRFLKKGIPVLDQLVEANPTHIEIRYLRLISCYYLPKFLGYSSNIEDDIRTLAGLLPASADTLPPDLYKAISTFIADHSDHASANQDINQSKQQQTTNASPNYE